MHCVAFRRAVLKSFEDGVSLRDLSRMYDVSINTIQNWRELLYETGDVVARPHGGGVKPVFDARNLARLERMLRDDNDMTVDMMVAAFGKIGIVLGRGPVERALVTLDWTRKKRRATPASATDPTSANVG